jgi:hypothetical protein
MTIYFSLIFIFELYWNFAKKYKHNIHMKHKYETSTWSNINTYTHTQMQKNTLNPPQKKQISKKNPYPNDFNLENCHM